MRKIFFFLCLILASSTVVAQQDTVTRSKKLKLSHAEPLYIDLIRDLGARKGEREFNVGFGFNDFRKFVNYSGFVEYEFAPINRLGFEIEMPFQFYRGMEAVNEEVPENGMEGLKLATQYTFLVSERYQTSLAVGYIQEFEMTSFNGLRQKEKYVSGTVYNPIFIAAKRWTSHLHTLLYTGPVFEQHFGHKEINMVYQLNANIHYLFPGVTSFIGLETNMEFSGKETSVVFRPQVKFKISSSVAIGWVTGIPLHLKQEGISSMVRLIWEPKKRL